VGAILFLSPTGFCQDSYSIAQRRSFAIGIKDNVRPLGFRGADGQLQGFEVDIARRLALELFGREDAALLLPLPNQDRIAAVLDGRVNLVIARVTLTGGRSRLVQFTTPYYMDGTALITRDPTVQKISDLKQAAIAVLNGSDTVEVLRYHLPQATLVGVDSYEAARALLETGEVLAAAADASVLTGWSQEDFHYRLVLPRLSAYPLAIMLPKGLQHEDLRRRIQEILDHWQEEGWLRQRAEYWGLPW